MESYSLKWPVDFEDYSWEIEAKGYFSELEIFIGDDSIKPNFYDPKRLMQDIFDDLASDKFFTIPRLIVVDRVSRDFMEAAIIDLAESGRLKQLK